MPAVINTGVGVILAEYSESGDTVIGSELLATAAYTAFILVIPALVNETCPDHSPCENGPVVAGIIPFKSSDRVAGPVNDLIVFPYESLAARVTLKDRPATVLLIGENLKLSRAPASTVTLASDCLVMEPCVALTRTKPEPTELLALNVVERPLTGLTVPIALMTDQL